MSRIVSDRKKAYAARMKEYLNEYKNILIVSIDHVGSSQMQQVRMALRGRGVVLMGKNTIMRKVITDEAENNPKLSELLPLLVGNVGFVFTNEDLLKVCEEVESNKVPAAARPGVVAPVDVFIPAGPTGLDPGQTAFFQALNIATKIVKGNIEIITQVHIVKKGEKVSPSAVSLLNKLDVKPFFFGIEARHVYENGSVYAASVLSVTEADLLNKFYTGVNKLTCVALEIGLPTLSTLPHSLARAFKKILAIAVETDVTFEEAKSYKEYLADPAAYAEKHGLVAAAPAAAAAAAADAAPAAAAAAADDEDEESDDGGFGMDLFD